MKFLLLLFSTLLLATPIFANRIMITKTSKKGNLSSINKQLNKLHLKMYVQKKEGAYIVFSKEFQSSKELHAKFRQVKHYFTSAYIQEAKSAKTSHNNSKNSYFVNVAYSISSMSADSANSAIKSESQSGSSYSVDTGFYFFDDYYLSLGYLATSIEDITIGTLYTAVGYNYMPYENINLYTGMLLGYSKLDMHLDDSTPSTSVAGGIELGISYDLMHHIPLSLTYQGLYLGHTIVYDASSELNFKLLHNIKIGVGYKF